MAVAAAAGACSSSPTLTNFDLTAPRQSIRGDASVPGQLIVIEPIAVQPLESERIVVKDAAGAVTLLPGAQWVDRLPRLVQARLVQTFENASRIKAVSRPGDRITPDYQLNTEIRSFQIQAAAGEALVEISAKIVDDKTGRITNARVFTARTPVGAIDPGNATRALDQSLSTVLLAIVRWVGTGGGLPPPAVTAAGAT